MIRIVAKLFIPLALLAAGTPISAAEYKVSSEHGEDSQLRFRGEVSGEAFEGEFHAFAGAIHFDPADLAATRFAIEIDVGSVDTDSEERDEALATSEWFDPKRFPKALFTLDGAQAEGDGYVAQAKLQIRDISKAVQWHFRIDSENQRLIGKASLDRTDWNLGGEDWSDEDLVAHAVSVEVDVQLVEQAAASQP